MPAYTTTLYGRQAIHYKCTFSVWRPTKTIVAGVPSGSFTWTSVWTALPGYLEGHPKISVAQGAFMAEHQNIRREDELHYPNDATLLQGDVIQMTVGTDVGVYWEIRGFPIRKTIHGNESLALLLRFETKPSGIT